MLPRCGSGKVAVPDPSVATTPAAPTTPNFGKMQKEWHYTCPSGCEGGAGSATACAKCGGAHWPIMPPTTTAKSYSSLG
ncbi:MAG: hypothetical protein R2788_21285 [Saprospiraceae bacterium]